MSGTASAGVHAASACGKVILLGEHAVVHGVTALAAGIDRGARAEASWSEERGYRLHVRDAASSWEIRDDSELMRAYRELLAAAGVERGVQVAAEVGVPTHAGLGSSACLGVAIARAVLSLDGDAVDHAAVERVATAWERVFHGNPSGIDTPVRGRRRASWSSA